MTQCVKCKHPMPSSVDSSNAYCSKCGTKHDSSSNAVVGKKPVGKVGLTIAAVFCIAMVYGAVVDKRGSSSSTDGITASVKTEAQQAIRMTGHTCDQVDNMRRGLGGTGYVVQCGTYRYSINDRGGNLTVQVE